MPGLIRHPVARRQVASSRYARVSAAVILVLKGSRLVIPRLAFASMTEKGELEVASIWTTQGCPTTRYFVRGVHPRAPRETRLAGVTLSAWATGLQVTIDQSIFAAYLENVKGKLRSTDIYDVP